jgi:HAD superfamily hydrolase (TIGR01509 family)
VDKEHVFYQCIGLRRSDSRLVLDRELGNLIDLERFDADWEHRIDARLSKLVPVKSGVEQVLKHLHKAGVPAVVATSTPTNIATANLKLAGLFDYMTAVLGGDQVEQGKPNPEIYIRAAGLAGCEARECVAFEDSDPGTLAAVRSGALTVQVPDLRPPSIETLALGHLVVSDLLTGARCIGLIGDTH